jgi:C-terminal processing protease CtpA/Prc
VIISRQSNKVKPVYFEFSHDKENNVAIMTIKGFSHQYLEKFKAFLEKHFNYIHEKNITNLIIDIRDNGGGSTNLSRELISCLTDKPFKLYSQILIKLSKQIEGKLRSKVKKEDEGKVVEFESSDIIPNKSYQMFRGQTYLLINRNTFSTALDLAAVLRYYSLAILVGEETKETPSGYGEIVFLETPNTKMRLQVSAKYFEALGDKKDGRGVVPDYEVYQKPEDTAKGVDTVLQFTLGLIKEPDS